MDKFIQRICDKLTENDISVFRAIFKKKDNKYYILIDRVLIVTETPKEITICFSVASTPEYAAKIMLALRSIKCEKITIGETFIYNEKGEYFGGTEAYKLLEKLKKDKIISEFVSESMQKQILMFNEDCYNC